MDLDVVKRLNNWLYSAVVACLALATFWTHPQSRTRFVLGTTNLIILFVALLFLRSCLPAAGAQMPLICEGNKESSSRLSTI